MYQRKLGIDDCEHEFFWCETTKFKAYTRWHKKITARKTGTRTLGTFTKLNKASKSED